MLGFIRRKKLLNHLGALNSALLKLPFRDLLKSVKFEKKKVCIIIEIPETHAGGEKVEEEIKNLGVACGFNPVEISVIVSVHIKATKSDVPSPVKKEHDIITLPKIKNIICVASCKGGVGKSTIALNVALDFLEKGYKVGLLDADIYGPSIPIMMQIQDKPDIISGRIQPIEKYGLKVISVGLLVNNQEALIWRGPMITKGIRSLFEDVNWGELDLLVVDLPPGTGDVYISLLTRYKVTGVLMVTSPHSVSLEELKKTIYLFKKFNVKTLGIVENMAEEESSTSNFDFSIKRQPFQKEGYIRTKVNFAEKLLI